jgi:large subunit ribosomal protein L21
MYAIVDIAGQQFKVEKDQKIFVHRLEGEEGSQVEFSQVLLVDDNGKVSVGTPEVEGASVTAKIIAHLKGDKVLVFKKKRRKGYQKMNGHRQFFSEITVESINTGGKKKAEKSPKAEKAPEAPVVEATPAQEEN